jgi:hypothetical protein
LTEEGYPETEDQDVWKVDSSGNQGNYEWQCPTR